MRGSKTLLTRSLRAQLSRSRVQGESEREGEEDSGTEEEGETEEAEDEARDLGTMLPSCFKGLGHDSAPTAAAVMNQPLD